MACISGPGENSNSLHLSELYGAKIMPDDKLINFSSWNPASMNEELLTKLESDSSDRDCLSQSGKKC